MIQSVNLLPSAHLVYILQQSLHLQCTLQPCTAICSQPSVHTAAIYNHLHCSYSIQCTLQLFYPVHTAANLQCTPQPCTAMYSYLQPTFSAHCSQLQPSTTIYTAAILSSAHCSYSIQCTLQQIFSAHSSYIIQCTLQQISSVHCSKSSVHTAAILSSAHCSYIIWCQYHTVHITSSAPLAHQKYVTA